MPSHFSPGVDTCKSSDKRRHQESQHLRSKDLGAGSESRDQGLGLSLRSRRERECKEEQKLDPEGAAGGSLNPKSSLNPKP